MSGGQKKVTYASVVGAVIAEEREMRQVSQHAAAGAAGLTQSTWARMELGRACTLENILKASHAFRFAPWQLFKVVDDRVKSLQGQGYEVVDEVPSEEKVRKESDEWLTTRSLITNASLVGLGAVAGAAAVSMGVMPYIEKLFGSKPADQNKGQQE